VINPGSPPDNSVNQLDPALIGAGGALNPTYAIFTAFRKVLPVSTPVNGTDYISMENTVKLDSTQYVLHPQLGYITLKQKLNADEVLR